jgi:hypothetical protein
MGLLALLARLHQVCWRSWRYLESIFVSSNKSHFNYLRLCTEFTEFVESPPVSTVTADLDLLKELLLRISLAANGLFEIVSHDISLTTINAAASTNSRDVERMVETRFPLLGAYSFVWNVGDFSKSSEVVIGCSRSDIANIYKTMKCAAQLMADGYVGEGLWHLAFEYRHGWGEDCMRLLVMIAWVKKRRL